MIRTGSNDMKSQERRGVAKINVGNCKLCGQKDELRISHVWPKYAYRQYVSDLKRGGEFLDLWNESSHNKQITRRWFCGNCEGILAQSEDFAARLCRKFDASLTPQAYDSRFTQFLTSISLRTVMYRVEIGPKRIDPDIEKILRPVLQHWKRFLRGQVPVVRPFSQHVFLVKSDSSRRHMVIGGKFDVVTRLVTTQIGPLYIVGLLDRRQLSMSELRAFADSETSTSNGILIPIQEFRVGENVPSVVVQQFWDDEVRFMHAIQKAAGRRKSQ